MGTGTGDEAETYVEEEDDEGEDGLEFHTSLGSSTQGNDAYTNGETGSTD